MADILPWHGVDTKRNAVDFMAGLYVYEIALPGGDTWTGIYCLLRLEPFSTKVVLPGELLEDPENDCAVDPVWLEYVDERGTTRARMERLKGAVSPRIDFEEHGARHRVWVINDPVSITAIREDFVDRKLTLRRGLAAYEAALARQRAGQQEFVFSLVSADAGEKVSKIIKSGLVTARAEDLQ